MGAVQTMDDFTNGIKRPVIFVRNLNESQLIQLAKKAGKHEHVFTYTGLRTITGLRTMLTQIFAHTNGDLGIAESPVINEEYEVLCTSYDEFVSSWEQYKLWTILQNTQ